MSNYTQSTNFATKDALPTGDPLKIVKGTEINTEFNNISIAIATKADTTSPTFTGTPVAPTATSGTDTTQISTTAFVQAAVAAAITTAKSALFPVGAIYTATVSTNPGTLLGFGTWTAFGAGRVLIGDGGGFSAGATGGSADATLPTHTHTFSGTTSTIGNHQHEETIGTIGLFGTGASRNRGQYGGGPNVDAVDLTGSAGSHDHTYSGTTAASGASPTNANLQPYIVVYMWTRTA